MTISIVKFLSKLREFGILAPNSHASFPIEEHDAISKKLIWGLVSHWCSTLLFVSMSDCYYWATDSRREALIMWTIIQANTGLTFILQNNLSLMFENTITVITALLYNTSSRWQRARYRQSAMLAELHKHKKTLYLQICNLKIKCVWDISECDMNLRPGVLSMCD